MYCDFSIARMFIDDREAGKVQLYSAGAAVQTVGHVRPNKPALKLCAFSLRAIVHSQN